MVDTYDPKKVVAIFGNQVLNNGITEGTFLTVARTTQTRSYRVGADGTGTIVVSNDKSATLTLTLRAGSATNDVLRDMQQLEDGDNPIYQVGTLTVQDFSGRSLISEENAFITGPPASVEYSDTEPSRVWTIMLPHPTIEVRGSLAPPRIGGVGNV